MPQNFRRNIYEISLRRPCAFVQTLSGFAKNAALRLTATAIPRFNVRQLLFRRVNYEKNYTESASVVIKAAQATPTPTATINPRPTPTATINPSIYIDVPHAVLVGQTFRAYVEIKTDGGKLEQIRWSCSSNLEGWITGDYSCSFRALQAGDANVLVEAKINGDTNYVTQNLLIKALYKRITGSSVGPAALCSNNRCSEVK